MAAACEWEALLQWEEEARDDPERAATPESISTDELEPEPRLLVRTHGPWQCPSSASAPLDDLGACPSTVADLRMLLNPHGHEIDSLLLPPLDLGIGTSERTCRHLSSAAAPPSLPAAAGRTGSSDGHVILPPPPTQYSGRPEERAGLHKRQHLSSLRADLTEVARAHIETARTATAGAADSAGAPPRLALGELAASAVGRASSRLAAALARRRRRSNLASAPLDEAACARDVLQAVRCLGLPPNVVRAIATRLRCDDSVPSTAASERDFAPERRTRSIYSLAKRRGGCGRCVPCLRKRCGRCPPCLVRVGADRPHQTAAAAAAAEAMDRHGPRSAERRGDQRRRGYICEQRRCLVVYGPGDHGRLRDDR